MGAFFQFLVRLPIFKAVMRFLVGMIAIPIFRFILRHVIRLQDMDKELEKDLEQWFRGALLLLVATQNMESQLFAWINLIFPSGSPSGILKIDWNEVSDQIVTALRIMLAVGVTEAMPDQELFAIIYPGPPKLKFERGRILSGIYEQTWPFLKGLACRHLDRSSQMFAIAAAIFPGKTGWVCYFLAITQYLVIGLVTSRSRAMDALEKFDQEVQRRREKLKEQITDAVHLGDEVPRPAPYETIHPPRIPSQIDAPLDRPESPPP